MNNIRPNNLDSGSFSEAASLLTEAFFDDPLYRAVLPIENKRRRALLWLHERVIEYCSLYGVIHTLPALEGIACWLPPGNGEVTFGRILRTRLYMMPFYFGIKGYHRFNRYMKFSEELRRRHGPDVFWYLWVLGVNPSFQGGGIGGRLMRFVLDEADKEGISCYLETENKQNLKFYEKNGFHVAGSGPVPGSKIMTWSMIRPNIKTEY